VNRVSFFRGEKKKKLMLTERSSEGDNMFFNEVNRGKV
jgi:hypothetical protein